jgi:hypothetical protein
MPSASQPDRGGGAMSFMDHARGFPPVSARAGRAVEHCASPQRLRRPVGSSGWTVGVMETEHREGGAVLTLSCSVAELQEWVRVSRPGDRLRYAFGADVPRNEPVWPIVTRLRDLGLVRLHSPRSDDKRGFDFIAVRISGPVAVSDATPDDRLLAEVERCAEEGEALPTDALLARRCGFESADAVSYRLRKLRLAGRLLIVAQGFGSPRIATIVATGKSTAGAA